MSTSHNYTEELRGMKDDISSLRADMAEIKAALLGNEFGDIGLAGRVKELEVRNKELQDFKEKVTYYSLGLGSAGGFLGGIIVKFIL